MVAAVRVRADYNATQLRELAKRSDEGAQTRRLLGPVSRTGTPSHGIPGHQGNVGLYRVCLLGIFYL